ncbi:MAG: hypothetical protein HQ596_02105 [Candidatus Saganbacteria bacterium]|nr:hypothetical protein [Candidatus Saganbacteria bacterium]
MGSEQKILETIKKLKQAGPSVIGAQAGFTSAYVDILCGSLLKAGKITKAEGRYKLAVGGKQTVGTVEEVLKKTGKKAAKKPKAKEEKKAKKKKKNWYPDWLK